MYWPYKVFLIQKSKKDLLFKAGAHPLLTLKVCAKHHYSIELLPSCALLKFTKSMMQ